MPDDGVRASLMDYTVQAERTPAERLPEGTLLVDLAGTQSDAPVIHTALRVEISLECLSYSCTWGQVWVVAGRIAFRGSARCPRCRAPLTNESGSFLRGVVDVRVSDPLAWHQEL